MKQKGEGKEARGEKEEIKKKGVYKPLQASASLSLAGKIFFL